MILLDKFALFKQVLFKFNLPFLSNEEEEQRFNVAIISNNFLFHLFLLKLKLEITWLSSTFMGVVIVIIFKFFDYILRAKSWE